MPGPGTESGSTGPARRLVESHGSDVLVIDDYQEYRETLDGTEYRSTYYGRRATSAIINRAGDFAREYLIQGVRDSQTVMLWLTPPGRDGEPVVRHIAEDAPADEQLLGGEDPSKDRYGPSVIRDTVNGDDFEVENVVTEQGGVRRVQAQLLNQQVNVEVRPEPLDTNI